MIPDRIISGGQTGVDRAALDFAIERGIPWGGWAPKGWRSEDGTIPERYRENMRETRSSGYVDRTFANVKDSTATLIINDSSVPRSPGTMATIDIAYRAKRGRAFHHVLDLCDMLVRTNLVAWLNEADLSTLNIAGPRESKAPGIYAATLALLREVWP